MNINPKVVADQKSGAVYADSRDVAKYFGKRHDNVLADIDKCISDCENLTPEFSGAKYKSRGKEYRCYHLTKDGFTFLVMGSPTNLTPQIWGAKYKKD